MASSFPYVPASTVVVKQRGGRGREDANVAAHQLLSAIGFSGLGTHRFFVGHFLNHRELDADGLPERSEYRVAFIQPLHTMAQHLGLAATEEATVKFEWTGEELTVTFARAAVVLGSFELAPLSEGQEALYLAERRLGRFFDEFDHPSDLLDVGDEVAALAAKLPSSWQEPEDDFEPRGRLGFAEDLERAGVGTWPALERTALAALVREWNGTSDALLDTALAVGIRS